MTVELQFLVSMLSGVLVAGITVGIFKGSDVQYKKDLDKRVESIEANIKKKVSKDSCDPLRQQCRDEIIRSLDDLKTGQEQIIQHLLNHKNGAILERGSDNDSKKNNITS